MKLSNSIVCVAIVTVFSGPALRAQQPPVSSDPISQAIRGTWESAKRNLRESAEQMPEADFAFRATDQVRTFGEILAHVAGANYVFCAPARNEKSPHEEADFEKTAKTKAEIVKALNDSMAYCDAAYTALTDRSAAEMIGTQARASTLIRNVGHLQEHYGNLVTYFRLKGMVPPSSRR
jgi:uncharacterized damage-inducible protein DinB